MTQKPRKKGPSPAQQPAKEHFGFGLCGSCEAFKNPKAKLCSDQTDPHHKCGIGFYVPTRRHEEKSTKR